MGVARGQWWLLFHRHQPPCFFEKEFLTGPELAKWSRMAHRGAPKFLSPSPQHWEYKPMPPSLVFVVCLMWILKIELLSWHFPLSPPCVITC